MIHNGNRRYPDSARTTTPNVYSFHSTAVVVHSPLVESTPYALSPSVPTPHVTRFQERMHSSRPVDQMHLICALSQPRRNVLRSGGAPCKGKSLSAKCAFSRTFLNV